MPHNTPEKRRTWFKKWYAKNKEKETARKRAWCKGPGRDLKKAQWRRLRSDPERYTRHKEVCEKRRTANRKKALEMYGGVCQCCAENRYEFLSFDHVGGGGKPHREVVHGESFIYWLLRKKRTGIRVLCHNCNLAYGFYGYCPHAGA